VTRFWLGRSGARRLLGLAIHGKTGKDILQLRERHSLLAGNFLTGKAEVFPNQKKESGNNFNAIRLNQTKNGVLQ
jgi:hypothetical protein